MKKTLNKNILKLTSVFWYLGVYEIMISCMNMTLIHTKDGCFKLSVVITLKLMTVLQLSWTKDIKSKCYCFHSFFSFKTGTGTDLWLAGQYGNWFGPLKGLMFRIFSRF